MPQAEVKKLYRSKQNRIISGILGGTGEYLNVDPVAIRIAYVAITVFSGFVPGIICYVIALAIIPEKK
ncbi:hypothetical protein A2165_04095 [Candidatus Curtissbacteria bacterium RBG_13_40_7]|uniref:Phage shock protein PspC N-terminal domain-containing protein n=1 Tax=Candidatus Curtissbacteria bacterium RBG_13_40_7 TaxID=1797706 RepID=A0A1F5FZH3_9BACT|nr:MAG: hypothetical protein A2165_04095 [Candidatus Curtissbacteria bacterium RBG_13_40_7]